MKLLIISNMAHYLRDGEIVGWGPTVREINYFANLFDEIRHIACLHPDSAPETSLHYSSNRISLLPLKPSGGATFRKKLGILSLAPHYMSTIYRQLDWADIVHVRCPANISLMAISMLRFVRNPKFRWVKYACNWSPPNKEAWSFRFQRWWLNKGLHRGIVTVNGTWAEQPPHVFSLVNPCFTDEELTWARKQAEGKQFLPPFQFLFAGRVENEKGVGRALDIVAELHRRKVPLRFDVVGDGDRLQFENKAKELGISEIVHFRGWMSRSDLDTLYAQSHFLLFPSTSSEGWPKVLSEAMAFGTIPLAVAISSIPQILATMNAGMALPVDRDRFVEAILSYIHHPDKWYAESRMAIAAAQNFTYSTHMEELTTLMSQRWGIHFPTYDKVLL